MEGCPRSLMLNVDLKESFPTEFTPSLKTYIREHYNEDADSYKNECSQLEQLRTASLRPSHDHSGCSTLRRYYAQLQFLQSRFPLGEGGAVNVQFTWTDLYSEEPISLCDIRFEQGAILHNLAALHSQLGCQEDRTAEEGMKVACTHFQAAAGIFQYLKVGSFCKVEHFIDHFASDAFFDMAGGLLQLYTNVMLGQAQECLLEKSILDSRKDSLIARISMQTMFQSSCTKRAGMTEKVHDYYNQALQFLDSQGPSYMGSRKAKLWTKSLKIKCCHYLAVAYIYMSNNADENQKFGEKVAYLKAASQKITEAQKASKGQPERTLEVLQFVVDVVSNKLQGAVKDNDFIYHEVVPELDALPEIKAAPLVKPIPFQPSDSSVSGPDIFQRLIPMEAHTDSSLYSEEKAKLLRRYASSIEQKNQLLSKALADLHIDDLLEPEGYDILPAVIKQKSDSLKKDGNLKDVQNNIEELTKIGSKVEDLLTSLAKMLEEDKQKEKELVELVGPMTPPPERKDFERDLEQCQESHKKAMQTNSELVKVFNEHKHNLDLLSGPAEGLVAALPSLNIIDTPIDDGAVQRLRDLISKVEQMKSQRKQLEAELRKELADDDITQLLVTREDGSKMIFFEEQLKKHDGKCAVIQANLDAQPKILKALTEANAKYAPTRQAVKETAQRRDDAVQSFILSHDTFFELKEKLSRGLRFYQGLEKTVLKLEEKLKEFYENRKKEMAKIEEKEKKAKEKAKPPPVRPAAAKPDHLVHSPASTVPVPSAGHYPGGPMIPNPGMRPGVPNLTPEGIPLHPRIPGGAFPPGSFPGAPPPHAADGRFYPSGLPGVPGRGPGPPGDPRVRPPGVPPQTVPDSGSRQIFPEQRVPQSVASQVSGPPVRPSMQPRPAVPFSQVGPRGPVPAEHLIHSTPRMSYPVPVGPSIPPGSQPGYAPVLPGGPYQVPSLPSQQPPGQQSPSKQPPGQPSPAARQPSGPQPLGQQPSVQQPPGQQSHPNFAVGQVTGPGGAQALPSYDQAKFIHGSQQLNRTQQPPIQAQQNWPQGQHPATSRQQSGGHPPQTFTSQQPFQAPRGPFPPSQHQQTSQAGSPQKYQPPIPSSSISSPLQPAPSQQPPRNWVSQPFQFPKLSQQPVRPQQPHLPLQPQRPLHPQQPMQPQQHPLQTQQTFSPQQPQPLQYPLHPQQQFQQPQQLFQRQQQPQPPHTLSQQQFQQPASSQPQLQQPLQPLKLTQIQQPFQPQHQSQPSLTPHHPSQFQQQPHQPPQPSQPPHQFQQPIQQFKQPPQLQQQFPQQQPQQPKELSQHPQQFQPTRQPEGQPQQLPQQQQIHSPMQPHQSYQQPLQPQRQSSQHSQQLPLHQHSQQPMQGQPFPQQTPHPGQTSQGPPKPQNVTMAEMIPQVSSQIAQMPGASKQRQMSDTSPQPPRPGYPLQQQPYTGYSPGQQALQPINKSTQPGYPSPLDKKGAQIGQPSPQLPKEGFPSQHSGIPRPGGVLPPHNTSASSSSWAYPQTSQPLPPAGAPLNRQPLSRQDSKEQQKGFGGKQVQGAQQPQSYNQSQGWSPSLATQQSPQEQPRQEQAVYPPGVVTQTSSDYGKQSQYPGQNRGRTSSSSSSYPPYVGSPSEPPLLASEGTQPHGFSQGSAPSAPLVQGVRPSPTSVPSSAYANSYSVSVAQAQLSQQQQMQQLQTQMLLQQQQLILQQQELLRHQQQQQQHDSDQGHIAQLFQQILQQQSKLTEMEQKLKDKEVHEPHDQHHNKEHIKEDHEGKLPSKQDKEVTEKDLHSPLPQTSGNFSASWGSGFSDQVHGKLDMDQIFSDLAKKQISGISEKGKHAEGNVDGSKPTGNLESDPAEHSAKTSGDDHSTVTNGENMGPINSTSVTKVETKTESVAHGVLNNTEGESSNSTEHKSEVKAAVDLSSSNEGKPEGKPKGTETSTEEDKEKERLREVEEQIQKIKELQKNSLPPLPPKQQYLYEPGKMPETCQLPIKRPDTKAAVEPSKPSLHRQCGHYYETQKSSIGQDENNECLSEEEYIQKLSYTVETFDALVVSLEQKRENAPYNGFVHEWKVLERMQETDAVMFSTQAATLNPSKNRYRDILPWDHTRVTLDTKEEGDYINANIIKKVTQLSPDYILTQGPVAATLGDFWLMVWERKSPVVVMLTKEVEGNRLKCHQYWPIDEGHTVVYGAMRVHMRSLNHCQAWIERIMHVQHAESDEVLVVSHLQFIGWPDHGVPHSPSDLLTFLSEVHNHHREKDPNAERPLVVHCSAGVGRAGTFCVIYTAIRELNGTGNIVNIAKLVRNFRKHRKFTVQKKEQYEFCYRAILFYANQFIQLEKTAIAFKKSKAASSDQLDDVSVSSPMTSLNSRGQRKPDEVSFLGEISDEESSDSESEEKGVVKSSIGLEPRGFDAKKRENENIRTENESQELKTSSEVIGTSLSVAKDATNTCEVTTSDADRSVATNLEEKSTPQDESQLISNSVGAGNSTEVTLEASTSGTDVSAVIDNKEEKNTAQDSSTSSNNSVNVMKETRDVCESPVSDANLSAVIEKSEGKMPVSESSLEQDNSKMGASSVDHVRESVESGLREEEETGSSDRKGTEVDVDYPSEKQKLESTERDEKETDVKGVNLSEENAKELPNVGSRTGSSDLSVKKIDSRVERDEGTSKDQEEQESKKDSITSQDGVEKLQNTEEQLAAESGQLDEGSEEQTQDKTHEQQNNMDTNLNDGLLNGKEPEGEAQRCEDRALDSEKETNQETTSKTDNKDESPQQTTQDGENEQTNQT